MASVRAVDCAATRPGRFVSAGIVACASVMTALSCSAGTSTTEARTGPNVPPSAALPAAQRSALADGKVTLAEYREAFGRWEDCTKRAGGQLSLLSTDPISGLIS